MSLVAWQRALRRQVAEEEMMACTATDERNLPGEYEVRNPQTRRLYKVVYRGEGSPWTIQRPRYEVSTKAIIAPSPLFVHSS